MNYRILVEDVRKSYGGVLVLDGVSLHAGEGEIVGVVGPNGAGKTTLLKIIAGIEDADSGRVRVRGNVGYVPQDPLLLPWKRLRGNIELGLVFRGIPREEARRRALDAARLLGIEEYLDYYPRQVSGGTARKASIARALALDPDVLLLDEPFTGLDLASTEALVKSLEELARRGYTMIIVSHQLDELVRLADRVYVLTPRPARVKWTLDLKGLSGPERVRVVVETLSSEHGER